MSKQVLKRSVSSCIHSWKASFKILLLKVPVALDFAILISLTKFDTTLSEMNVKENVIDSSCEILSGFQSSLNFAAKFGPASVYYLFIELAASMPFSDSPISFLISVNPPILLFFPNPVKFLIERQHFLGSLLFCSSFDLIYSSLACNSNF